MASQEQREVQATEYTPLIRTISGPDEGPATIPGLSDENDDGKANVTPIRGFCVTLSLGVLIFLQFSNMSLLTTIQSPIADELNAYADVSWFASVYMIAMSSITPLAGRLCQIFRPESYILVSCVIFSCGLLATSMAPTLPWFLVGRALTGIGAAGNFAVGIIVIVNLTSLARRGLFMGLLNSAFTVGVALGAIVAAILEPKIGWRGTFAVQIPFALSAGILMFCTMPSTSTSVNKSSEDIPLLEKVRNIDYLGVATLVPFIVLLLLGLASPHGIKLFPILISLLFLNAFLYTEMRFASNPIIPISLLKSRAMLFTCFATLLIMMSRWTVLFYSPVYAISVKMWEPAHAGTVLLATNGGFAAGGLIAGWLHIRRAGSFYLSCLVTFALFSWSLFALSNASNHSVPISDFLVAAFCNGFVTGAGMNYTVVHLFHLTDSSTHVVATSVIATFRGFAGSFGASIGGGLFSRVLRKSLTEGFDGHGLHDKQELIGKLLGSPRLVSSLSGVDRVVAIKGYEDAIRTLFITGSAVAILATLLQAGTGWLGFDPRKKADNQSAQAESI